MSSEAALAPTATAVDFSARFALPYPLCVGMVGSQPVAARNREFLNGAAVAVDCTPSQLVVASPYGLMFLAESGGACFHLFMACTTRVRVMWRGVSHVAGARLRQCLATVV